MVAAGQRDTLDAPPPDLTPAEAAALAARLYGAEDAAIPLDSERDQNFRVGTGTGSFVLKVANPAEDPAVIAMQVRAMRHVAVTDPGLPVPRVLPNRQGEGYTTIERNGRQHLVHAVSFLPGEEVALAVLDEAALHAFGAVVARMGKALRGFFDPAADRTLLWDVKQALGLHPLVRHLGAGERLELVERVLGGFEERALPAIPRLRSQIVHGDLTLTNVLFDGALRPSAVVDFGDLMHTPLVFDLAVALAAVLRGGEATFDTAEAVIGGYESVTILEDDEIAVLPDAVAARLAATVVISAWRTSKFPENTEYITALDEGSWPVLELFDGLGRAEVERRFHRAARRGSSRARTDELLERRRRVFGPAHYGLSYERPLHLVRAEGVWMFDAAGRRFLDAYNNVPVVGHSHPRVVEAVARQARLLNTNTRYLHETAVELAERLTATMPEGLDTCLFVNSGSEANELAWRLATASSGGSGGLVADCAYHGVTVLATDLSPSEWPEGHDPAHVATFPAPDGSHGVEGVDAALERLQARGHAPAVLYAEPAWTSSGIYTDAPEFLAESQKRVHAAGALVVADEVQAGYGRLGSDLWSFQRSGITPDLVTLGKPMGNGYPVAAVIARREIAEAFARGSPPIFSTFGGNPVACAAALAVLDVLEEEELVAGAAEVGAYLGAGFAEIARRHPAVEAVRGAGLLWGIEVGLDREGARTVMNGMRERGVLVGTTGPGGDVLKIRPPLPFAREHADLALEALDEALAGAALI